jgi:hypothetical protein
MRALPASPLRFGALGLCLTLFAVACGESASGSGGTAPAAPAALTVQPQNSTLLVGENRLGLALLQGKQPVLGADASVQVQSNGRTIETEKVEFAGHEYKDIPYYLGAVSFPAQGLYHLVVNATLRSGSAASGAADVLVTTRSPELPIGFRMPALKQPVAGDVGGKLSLLDSGVPPDAWHTATVADGLAQHKPMIVYFGQPGRCVSQTCGPTITVLQELCKTYCSQFLFEHIEVHYPASADSTNPAFAQLGFQSEPWVYFVNSNGIVADRYEGPVTLAQLQASAAGTLAGKVPAVTVTVSS